MSDRLKCSTNGWWQTNQYVRSHKNVHKNVHKNAMGHFLQLYLHINNIKYVV